MLVGDSMLTVVHGGHSDFHRCGTVPEFHRLSPFSAVHDEPPMQRVMFTRKPPHKGEGLVHVVEALPPAVTLSGCPTVATRRLGCPLRGVPCMRVGKHVLANFARKYRINQNKVVKETMGEDALAGVGSLSPKILRTSSEWKDEARLRSR
jgi:hypothetical protein